MKRSVIFLALLMISGKVCFSQNDCGICEQLKNNVVKITTSFSDNSDANGFGTIIAENGDRLLIVTAKHVIYKLEDDKTGYKSSEIDTKSVNIKFNTDGGNDYPAHLLRNLNDNPYDITLLEVTKPQNFTWTKNFYSDAVERGTPVWFIGRAGDWYIPIGPNIGAINNVSYDDVIIIDINSIRPGTSGAPLISKDGIVGVIFEDDDAAKAYPIERVKKIIASWNYVWQMNLYKKQQPPEISSIRIGNQFLMTKNLDVASYRNGDPIPNVTDPKAWEELTTGAYCYYDNDSVKYAAIYGKLYNWYAVNDPRGLAPKGWHVLTDAEWSILSSYLGGEKVAGGKMKETGTSHWLSPNTGASNSSGFGGLPGGFRNEGGYGLINVDGSSGRGYWRSSTEDAMNYNYAWTRYLRYDSGSIGRGSYRKQEGFSVRCLRD